MSDENKTEDDDWRLDSLDEEDDIIELTEEIEPPSQPVISKQGPQDQLDEIVIDLEDTAELKSTELEDIAPIEEAQEQVFDLGEENVLAPDDEVHELMEAAVEDSGSETLAPFEETEEQVFDLGDDAVLEPEGEVGELMEATIDDVGFDEMENSEDSEDIALDFETEILSGAEIQSQELQEEATVLGDLGPGPLPEDAEKLEFEFEEDASAEPYEQIEELSVAALEEIGLEEMQPLDSAEEFGMPDIETEVDIAEVADLEPIQSELPAEEPPGAEPEAVMLLQEELKADPDAVMELQEELTADLVDPVISGSDDIIEISDFDQQYFSDEEAQSATSGLPSVDAAEEEDFLELIDVEDGEEDDAELDDEIIHFDHAGTESDATKMDDILAPDQDDFDLEPSIRADSETLSDLHPSSSRELTNESAEASLISGADDFLEKAPVPGFFESTGVDEGGETEIQALADPLAGDPSEEMDDSGAAVIPAAVSAAQIEAAVANIIERDYADRIEGMVATAIEKVVSLEIERIKSSLFGDEED